MEIKNIKKVLIAILAIILIIITFKNQYNYLIRDFESTAKAKESLVKRYIDLSCSVIDLLTIYGNNYFEQVEPKESELYSYLKHDSNSNNYNLDAIDETEYQNKVGSLTGIGSIPADGISRDEINLALHYNEYFHIIYSEIPDIAWLYYTSENNFISMYPWISSKEFAFSNELKTTEFYSYAIPENNPLRKTLWTPVYLDQAGKGLMVTLTSPIYNQDTFMGVVSLDLTNAQFSKMIESDYEIYLVDDTDSLIATSLNHNFDQEIKFSELNRSQNDINMIDKGETETIQRVGKYYIYSVSFTNAPWKMFFRVPVWLILYKSMLFTLPIMIICILFVFRAFEAEKRKEAETQLISSLEELKSYQELLENAAKYDFLTSTYNRRGLKESFDNIFNSITTTRVPVSFILGDIDSFKKFNDTFGHTAGDKILIELSNLLKKNAGESDIVCRWGGEEFLIMLHNKDYDEALVVAENIRREIETMVIPWENSIELRVTMTFGVAEYDFTESYENSISQADIALYIGKLEGRNQVIGYLDPLCAIKKLK